ncbi:hypothetical protein EJ07DRAFT_155212 [Lizonia empirigonia]|nr:hypothetical protein EJ07DRAFT_155212 [Lizonia empirigonia]
MDLWGSYRRPWHSRDRHRRRGCLLPCSHDRYEAYDYMPNRRHTLRGRSCYDWCQICTGDYRRPYEILRRYDPIAEMMQEVHDSIIEFELNHFLAAEWADTFEEASLMLNRMFGHDPHIKAFARFLKQTARDVQLLPDRFPVPFHARPRCR